MPRSKLSINSAYYKAIHVNNPNPKPNHNHNSSLTFNINRHVNSNSYFSIDLNPTLHPYAYHNYIKGKGENAGEVLNTSP